MNINERINYLFASKRENPEKFFRAVICGERSYVAMPDGGAVKLQKAIVGEFQDGKPVFVHKLDENDLKNQDGRYVSVVMRENKELAYLSGSEKVERQGYIRCAGKKDEDDEDSDYSEERLPSNRMFCGVFTTQHYTIFLVIGEMFKKTVLRDFIRRHQSEPELLEALSLFGLCSENESLEVKENVEE